MNLEFTSEELLKLYDCIMELQKLNSIETSYKFRKFLINLRYNIGDSIKIIQNELNRLNELFNTLNIEYCNKDDNGHPIMVPITEDGKIIGYKYQGLLVGHNKEYDRESKKIKKEREDFLNLKNNISGNEYVFMTSKELPKSENFKIYHQDILQRFIID